MLWMEDVEERLGSEEIDFLEPESIQDVRLEFDPEGRRCGGEWCPCSPGVAAAQRSQQKELLLRI